MKKIRRWRDYGFAFQAKGHGKNKTRGSETEWLRARDIDTEASVTQFLLWQIL